MKKAGAAIPAIFGMCILILDSKTALLGAQEGLSLCIRTVIPSLFPFFVLSILLTGSLMGGDLPFLRPLGRLTGIPLGAESILLAGFLGGYPVGAQSIGTTYEKGQLSDADARRMLAFCNNCGPAFLFGMAASLFPYRWIPWALWAIHIASALAVSWLIPGTSCQKLPKTQSRTVTLPSALHTAVRVMAGVCGWVILFRVMLAFLDRWFAWLLPTTYRVILAGILELSNGCCALTAIDNLGQRFVLCSAMLAFGGLCVSLQTVSVAGNADIRLYFPGKLLQTAISVLLSLLVQTLLPQEMSMNIPLLIPAFLSLLFLAFLPKLRKRGSIPAEGIV